MNKCRKISGLLILLCILLISSTVFAFADSPTDEIVNYTITADVNDDAAVTLTYHIDWKVLESDGIGPMSWVTVGIPNSNCTDIEPLSANIDRIENKGSELEIYFNDEYYEGETAAFDFSIVQDYMYEMNAVNDGETMYYFTPGWFDEISVDDLVIRWNKDKLVSWSGGALEKDGYMTWETQLAPGDTFTVQLSYPNDAYSFRESSSYSSEGYSSGGMDAEDVIFTLIAIVIFFGGFFVLPIAVVIFIGKKVYESMTGFGSGTQTTKKVTRTKIEYYSTCPGCGAARNEGEKNCSYCGHSFIKSETEINEEEVTEANKEAMKYDTDGEYRLSSSPNTYVRVHVVPVVMPSFSRRPGGPGRSAGTHRSSRSSGSSHHSSCAHSSCACASCACACACACAGGGRAGCTTKDFYNTGLKLRQLELKKKEK